MPTTTVTPRTGSLCDGFFGRYNGYDSYEWAMEENTRGMGSAYAYGEFGTTDCKDCMVQCCTEGAATAAEEPGCSGMGGVGRHAIDGHVADGGTAASTAAPTTMRHAGYPVRRRRMHDSFAIVDMDTNATLETHEDEQAKYHAAMRAGALPRYKAAESYYYDEEDTDESRRLSAETGDCSHGARSGDSCGDSAYLAGNAAECASLLAACCSASCLVTSVLPTGCTDACPVPARSWQRP